MKPLVAIVGWGACLLWLGASAAAEGPSADELAARIDERVERRSRDLGLESAPAADDAEFVRRAHLDFIGRIPRVAEVRAFLADPAPDKRARLIDRLLADPRFARHWAQVWRAELLPEATSNRELRVFQAGFEAWLRERIAAGTPYDVLVRELLTLPLPSDSAQAAPVLRNPESPNPLAFYAVKEAKPENLAAAVTRTFLGIRLECAQCHDHPTAAWKQDQFWRQAAFFGGLRREGNNAFASLCDDATCWQITPPQQTTVQAEFLDGARPDVAAGASPRAALAAWVTAPDNPHFARTAANRLWGYFFARGLIHPVDDVRDDNPPSDPELLDDLTQALVAADFDLAHLMRAIGRTQAYQRTSVFVEGQPEPALPARMAIKALSGEQFFESLALATGYDEQQDKGAARRQFLTRFASVGPFEEPETSVQQALTLLNGPFLAWATDAERCPTLLATTQLPGLSRGERIETLYLAALARPPAPDELSRLEAFFADAEPVSENERLADLFWALLNSAEFRVNH